MKMFPTLKKKILIFLLYLHNIEQLFCSFFSRLLAKNFDYDAPGRVKNIIDR